MTPETSVRLPLPPLVVGVCAPDALVRLAQLPAAARLVDLVEARLDLALPASGGPPRPPPPAAVTFQPWLDCCRTLEQSGTPVLITVRRVPDGGRWNDDLDRLELLEAGLDVASWIDIEVESALAAALAARAHQGGDKVVVVSHHDFSGTPAPAALDQIVERARALGADVVKVATRVDTLADHDTLVALLRRWRDRQVMAVVGMGPFGTSLRGYLPCVGSRLAYGFLDAAVAPGQISAEALVARLGAECPSYLNTRRPGAVR